MSVTVSIHPAHRQFTGGLPEVEVEGTTVGDCLRRLVGRFPAMEGQLFDGHGKLQRTVVLLVNEETLHADELDRRVTRGDTIHVTLLLGGG